MQTSVQEHILDLIDQWDQRLTQGVLRGRHGYEFFVSFRSIDLARSTEGRRTGTEQCSVLVAWQHVDPPSSAHALDHVFGEQLAHISGRDDPHVALGALDAQLHPVTLRPGQTSRASRS